MPNLAWTDAQVATLKTMWADGKSTRGIMVALGAASRNTIIGKVHRLRLAEQGRAAPSSPSKPKLSGAQRRRLLGAPRAPATKKVTRQARDSVKPPKTPQAPFIIGNRPSIEPKPPTPIRERHEEPGLATILTITSHMCRWPIGDPESDDFTFCGAKKTSTAYCQAHARIAYQPQSTSKRNGTSELARSLRRYA